MFEKKIKKAKDDINEEIIASGQRIIAAIKENVPSKSKTNFETIVEINREQLGLLNLKDIRHLESMEEAEKRSYIGSAEAIYSSPVFKNELAILMQKQLEFSIQFSPNYEADLISRGSINGVSLVEERFKELHLYFMAQVPKPKGEEEDFDPNSVV